MLLIDMIMALGIILYLTVGADGLTDGELGLFLFIAVGLVIAVHVGVAWVLDWISGRAYHQSEHKMSSRRRMLGGGIFKTKAEERLDTLNETELREHIEKRPKDHQAVEILCERLAGAGRWAEYAREMEYFLTLDAGLSVEETCGRYHRLAEVYQHRLGRPERAREMLHTLIATYPKHYQATLARRRLAALDAGAPTPS